MEPSYNVHLSLPRDRHNARGFGGKVYGVCTLARYDLPESGCIGEVETVGWDLEGRVLVYKLPTRNLAVINVYAVNGTENDYHDPDTGEVAGTR